MKITKIVYMEACHSLGLDYDSKCKHLHGHSYKVEVTIEGKMNRNDMVLDYSIFKQWIKQSGFDHCNLDDVEYFQLKNPTAENLCLFLKSEMERVRNLELYSFIPNDIKIKRIRIYETRDNYAECDW